VLTTYLEIYLLGTTMQVCIRDFCHLSTLNAAQATTAAARMPAAPGDTVVAGPMYSHDILGKVQSTF
jgi:hypothetical protein